MLFILFHWGTKYTLYWFETRQEDFNSLYSNGKNCDNQNKFCEDNGSDPYNFDSDSEVPYGIERSYKDFKPQDKSPNIEDAGENDDSESEADDTDADENYKAPSNSESSSYTVESEFEDNTDGEAQRQIRQSSQSKESHPVQITSLADSVSFIFQ